MLRPIDRTRRDAPLYPGSSKNLSDFIDPKHLLRRIDANFDFESLVAFLRDKYDPEIGRPAIHPEVLVRALLLCAVYDVGSYRQLCERIGENLAWRWFCHLALEDRVFDHSTITYFIERLGEASFQELLDRLNAELARLNLLSSRTYADSSLVKANAGTRQLKPSKLSPKSFKSESVSRGGVRVVLNKQSANVEENRPARFEYERYQDDEGRLRLSIVDPDARWRKPRPHSSAILGYKDNIIVDKSGFILARRATRADVSDVVGVGPLLDRLPIAPKTLAADTGFRAGWFRHALHRQGIVGYIPLHPTQESSSPELTPSGFAYHGDHLICPQGHTLKLVGLPSPEGLQIFQSARADCEACPRQADCLTNNEALRRRKRVGVNRYEYDLRRAQRLNATTRFEREMSRRQTVVEGVFARLDRLDFLRARLRGLGKVDCQATISAFAHNILKALTKVRSWGRDAKSQRSFHRFDLANWIASLLPSGTRPTPLSPSIQT